MDFVYLYDYIDFPILEPVFLNPNNSVYLYFNKNCDYELFRLRLLNKTK